MLVIGGTAVLDAQRRRTDHLVLHHLDEARFANPRLPTQHYHVTPARRTCAQRSRSMPTSCSRPTSGVRPRRRDIEALLDHGLTHDLVDLERRGHTFERLGPKLVTGKIPLDQPLRHRADDDGIGRCQPLETRRNVWRVSQGQLFLPPATTHLPHDDDPGVDPHADRQRTPRPVPGG